jgi:hypothetical protein
MGSARADSSIDPGNRIWQSYLRGSDRCLPIYNLSAAGELLLNSRHALITVHTRQRKGPPEP